MSEQTTLEIFKPLKTYFNILCTNECYSRSSCDKFNELIDILTKKDCNSKNITLSENFLDALSWFASELKQADTPIGVYTIKDKLKKIFMGADSKNYVNYVNYVVNAINNAGDLSGFKMSESNGESQTYEEILKTVLSENSGSDNENIFNEWLDKAFKAYGDKEKYFSDNIKPKLANLDECQKMILNTYFQVVVNNNKISIDNYMKDMNTTYKDSPARLNIIVNDNKPKLFELFPESVKDAFEKYLVSPKSGSMVLYETPDCYKLKIGSEKGKSVVYKAQNVKELFKWAKDEALGVRKEPTEEVVVDSEDTEPYTDKDNEKFKYPSSFDTIVNFQDEWRADLTGKLWRKDSTGKYVEYSDKDMETDSKKFKDGEGNCGELCIFDNPTECSEFFEKMMKRESYGTDDLNKIINSANFVNSYKKLQENIVKVNPLFVIGTLRMFGFQKYTSIDEDGQKTVKIESFTNWWNRYSDKLKLTLTTPFPGTHQGLKPEPPANLELFFKLLIAFINNNSFVLNPQSKALINKAGPPKVKILKPVEFFMINGEKVKNNYYEEEMAHMEGREYKKPNLESLPKLLDEIRKNSVLKQKPINMSSSENLLNLPILFGLMAQVTTGHKIRLAKHFPFSSGKGYLVGGSKQCLPCSANAAEIYIIAEKALRDKGKKLNATFAKEISDQISSLTDLEKKVYNDLKILAHYQQIVSNMDDKTANDNVTKEIMVDAIKEFDEKSKKLSSKSDSLITKIQNILEYGPSGRYSPLQ
jgi:hypothetical protein